MILTFVEGHNLKHIALDFVSPYSVILLFYVMSCHVIVCDLKLYGTTLYITYDTVQSVYCTISYNLVLCYAVLRYVMLRYAILYYPVLSYKLNK